VDASEAACAQRLLVLCCSVRAVTVMLSSRSPILCLGALAALLLCCACVPAPVAAFSAAIWDASTDGSCYGPPAGSRTHLGNGDCYRVEQYGARVQCTPDGRVTQAALFTDYDCGYALFSGSGIGDGVSCIRMSSRSTPGVYFSAVVDCSAPGPKPGQCGLRSCRGCDIVPRRARRFGIALSYALSLPCAVLYCAVP
jgi:hypothetical protein